MVFFEDKTIRNKKTAALLLYTQLEHDKFILQEQQHRLLVFSFFDSLLAFMGFLSSREVPIAVFDKRAFYLLTREQFCVNFMRKID